MAGLGFACLLLALAVCLYGIGASLYGVRSGRTEFSDSGRRAVYALAGILTVAFAVLEVAFLRNDFVFNTVADTSSRTTPLFYRAAAVWSSQEGSLLLWAWLLSLWSSLALFLTRRADARRRRLRDRDPARLRRLLHLADDLLREPLRHDPSRAGRRRRARSPAALSHDDDPSPDALLGLHAVHDPAGLRHGRAAGPQGRRGLDQSDPALRVRGLAVPRRGHPAGRALVLLGARLGWLLGLGRRSRTPR